MTARGLVAGARRVATLLALFFGGLVAALYVAQERLIFPGAYRTVGRSHGAGDYLTLALPSGGAVQARQGAALSRDGAPLPDAAARPHLLYFHGNGERIEDLDSLLRALRTLGVNVLAPEYRGYDGSAPSEEGCAAAADAAFDHLSARSGGRPILVAGWSLGGGVAVGLASRRPAAALVVLSSFSTLADAASAHYRVIPAPLARALLRHRFDSARAMRDVRCPVLIAHGRDDTLLPFRMGEALASAAPAEVKRLWIDGAGHDLFASGPSLWIPLEGFVRRVAAR